MEEPKDKKDKSKSDSYSKKVQESEFEKEKREFLVMFREPVHTVLKKYVERYKSDHGAEPTDEATVTKPDESAVLDPNSDKPHAEPVLEVNEKLTASHNLGPIHMIRRDLQLRHILELESRTADHKRKESLVDKLKSKFLGQDPTLSLEVAVKRGSVLAKHVSEQHSEEFKLLPVGNADAIGSRYRLHH